MVIAELATVSGCIPIIIPAVLDTHELDMPQDSTQMRHIQVMALHGPFRGKKQNYDISELGNMRPSGVALAPLYPALLFQNRSIIQLVAAVCIGLINKETLEKNRIDLGGPTVVCDVASAVPQSVYQSERAKTQFEGTVGDALRTSN
ncbi:MAG: hypothetical protein ACKPKO_08950, partial [Candidatus Fonsibacter sp.]